MAHDPDCLFCKIIDGKIPSRKAFENDEFLAFADIHPAAPIHLLLVPKDHIPSLSECKPEHQEMLGRMMLLAPKLAKEAGETNGLRVSFNNGPDGGQEVYHMHLHIMAGPRPWLRG
jgi:histidine triad (HIT) family protein